MLGSILSNTLLVLGMCYFAGGLRFHEQGEPARRLELRAELTSLPPQATVFAPLSSTSTCSVRYQYAVLSTLR
jgi:Ca2+:H+ antiporter